MKHWLRYALLAMLVTAVRSLGAAPSDADRETARDLMDQGAQRYQAQDYTGALERFRAADALMHVPTTGVAVARALAAMGKLVEARSAALDASRLPVQPNESSVHAEARDSARKLANELGERVPSLRFVVSGAPAGIEVHVTVDGDAIPAAALGLPRKANPGKHRVLVTAEGMAQETREVELKERQTQTVTIELKPLVSGAAPTPDKTQAPKADRAGPASAAAPAARTGEPTSSAPAKKSNTLTYVGFGVGAVGVALGAVTGILAMSKASSAKDHCVGHTCTAAAQNDIDSGLAMARVSDVAFAVGVVGLGAGLYSLFSGGSSPAPASADVRRRQATSLAERSHGFSLAGRF
jgi:hypothetical protein